MTQISNVALIRQAQTWFAEKRYDDADRICRELLKRQPNNSDALVIMAEMEWDRRDRKQAFSYLQRLLKANPRAPFAHVIMAEYLDKDGRTREAIRLLEKCQKFAPTDPLLITSLARSYEFNGDLEKAIALLEPHVVAGTATPAMAHQYAGILFEQKQYQRTLEIELKEVRNPAVAPRIRESMFYLLGRTYEALGQNDDAFLAYEAANRVIPSEANFDDMVKAFDEILEAYSAEWMKRLPRARNNSRLPVFIICRPRSGSTLVERIIASHPQVHEGGEREEFGRITREMNLHIGSTQVYPQCIHDLDQSDVDRMGEEYLRDLQALAPRALRVTDKYITNWPYLGLISLILPKATIIDLRRDAIDNCLGIFTAQLKFTQPFTRDLREIALHQKVYERVMDHWYNVLDMPMLRVNYEDIVADQEYWSRKIIEHCGLEWDDRCLRFYEKGAQQSSTANPTLSFKQVRQPIYKTSVARAKKFEKHLKPLYEGLGLPYPGNG